MALSEINWAERVNAAGLNIYTVAEGDAEGNIRVQKVIPANPTYNCYSIAKAYSVLAVGICRDRGLIDTDARIADVLGRYLPADADEKWQRVTLHDVLRHRVGYDAGLLDIDAEDASGWASKDYLSLCFRAPLVWEAGEHRQYTDAAYYMVSRVVSEVTGQKLVDFLRPVLFDVLNFDEAAWSCCPQGYSMGATGLYLRTGDLVKLGMLWLRNGDWNGRRVVSADWVRLTEERGYEFSPKTEDGKWFGKGGMRGQMLAYNREQGLAVAWNAYGKVPVEKMLY